MSTRRCAVSEVTDPVRRARNDPVTGPSGPCPDRSRRRHARPSFWPVRGTSPPRRRVLRESTRDHGRDAGVAGVGAARLRRADRASWSSWAPARPLATSSSTTAPASGSARPRTAPAPTPQAAVSGAARPRRATAGPSSPRPSTSPSVPPRRRPPAAPAGGWSTTPARCWPAPSPTSWTPTGPRSPRGCPRSRYTAPGVADGAVAQRPSPEQRAWLAELGDQLDRLPARVGRRCCPTSDPLTTLVVEVTAALVEAGLPLHDAPWSTSRRRGRACCPSSRPAGSLVSWRAHDRMSLADCAAPRPTPPCSSR